MITSCTSDETTMSYHHILDEQERRELLRIARATLTEYLDSGLIPPGKPHKKSLLEPAGAFVTLKTGTGDLRGCIGTFAAARPIYATIQDMAVAAATSDPRFPPVTLDELGHLSIEISLLSGLEPIRPEDVVVGEHGLAISLGGARGVLLPQVPLEWGWDRETFLEQVCFKAGLPRDAYRNPAARLEAFTAQVFSEDNFALDDGA